MSEYDMRGRVVRALRPLHAFGVENPVYPGTPDVNYIEGWLELKQMPSWPARPETPLLIPHYTQQQRVWIYTRWLKGGRVHLLLKVANEWMIFRGDMAYHFVGKVNRNKLATCCARHWPAGLDDTELETYLRTYENQRTGTAKDLASSQELEPGKSSATPGGDTPALLPFRKRPIAPVEIATNFPGRKT